MWPLVPEIAKICPLSLKYPKKAVGSHAYLKCRRPGGPRGAEPPVHVGCGVKIAKRVKRVKRMKRVKGLKG